MRLAGLAVNNSFEIAGLQNGRGRVWAAGVVTASGPYAAVDSFLGLQFAALRSVDHLGALRAPGVSRFGPLRSSCAMVEVVPRPARPLSRRPAIPIRLTNSRRSRDLRP